MAFGVCTNCMSSFPAMYVVIRVIFFCGKSCKPAYTTYRKKKLRD